MKCQFFLSYSPGIFITNAVVKHQINLNIPEDYFRSISFFQINLLSCQEFYQAILTILVILTNLFSVRLYCHLKIIASLKVRLLGTQGKIVQGWFSAWLYLLLAVHICYRRFPETISNRCCSAWLLLKLSLMLPFKTMSRGNSSCFYLSLGKFVKFLQRNWKLSRNPSFSFYISKIVEEKCQWYNFKKKVTIYWYCFTNFKQFFIN